MTQFEIKGNKYYRLSHLDSKVINNNIISDELALEFLRIAPSRIRLFSKFPENWEVMLSGDEDQVEVVKPIEKLPAQDNEPAQLKREALRKYKMTQLREMYPNVKEAFGGKKEDFITAIINSGQ